MLNLIEPEIGLSLSYFLFQFFVTFASATKSTTRETRSSRPTCVGTWLCHVSRQNKSFQFSIS